MTQFRNRIRLPLLVGKPQFPETRTVYRKTDGTTKVQSIVIRKTYQGETDYISERLHERIKIAIAHDSVNIEADNYFGALVQSADYQISWLDMKNYPIAKAAFQAEVSPFDATNSNCQTCADASAIVTNDDTFYPDLNENTTYTLDVSLNDAICCFPVTWSITSFNTAFLSSASIDSTGLITIHTKTGLTTANLIDLLTYRATCPNGNYDEADVFANINGTVAGCLAPSSISVSNLQPTQVEVDYTPPSPLPDHYHFKVYSITTNTFVQEFDQATGFTSDIITGLSAGQEYIVFMRSACAPLPDNSDANASNYISDEFTTPNQSNLCGEYTLSLNDPSLPGPGAGGHINVTYLDCNGVNQVLYLPNFGTKAICAMQSGPGSPTSINTGGNAHTTITYRGVCGGVPTLTFSVAHSGTFVQLEATLSSAIDADINISRFFSDGFGTSDCSGGAITSAQKNSTMTIVAGGVGVGSAPDSVSVPWSSSVTNYSVYNIIVNGIPCVNGTLLTIGSFQVLMVIPACD